MPEQNLGQRRAADALQKITALRDANAYGHYPSYVKALPATIINCGLGQAAAMLLASAKLAKPNRTDDHRAYKSLYDHLSTWLCKGEPDPIAPYQGDDLMKALLENDQEAYMRAQAEALAYLEWLKKFSDAFLDGGQA